VMEYCVGLVMKSTVTRDDLDDILKKKGWRQARNPEPAAWRWTIKDAGDEVIIGIRLPRLAVPFFRRLAGRWLSLDLDAPEAIFPA